MTELVLDTSALVAIVTGESDREWLAEQVAAADECVMAAPTALEFGIVLEARVPTAIGVSRRALRDARVALVPFDDDLAERALDGWRRFGKGRHAAGLNFGDCITYALAERTGYPILCAGDEFARTDLPVVRPH